MSFLVLMCLPFKPFYCGFINFYHHLFKSKPSILDFNEGKQGDKKINLPHFIDMEDESKIEREINFSFLYFYQTSLIFL